MTSARRRSLSDRGASPKRRNARSRTSTPAGSRTLGVGAWLILGVAAVLALLLFVVALVAGVAIPLAIAVVFAAVLVPLTDRLERWRVPRWLAATLVLILALSTAVAIIAVVVGALAGQGDEIWAQLQGSLDQVEHESGPLAGVSDRPIGVVASVARLLTSGLLGSLFGSASSFVVGSVLAIFMLLFLFKDWQQITG